MRTTLHPPRLVLPVTHRDHLRGSSNAPIVLLEYGDYECPQCVAVRPILQTICNQFTDQICYVFRNFPSATIHPHSVSAAEAAEAAGAQGKFWEMHDFLFEMQSNLEKQNLLLGAKLLELDIGRFEYDLNEHIHMPRVQEDFHGGIRSGINGTPSFFINGVRYTGNDAPQSLSETVLTVNR